MLALFGIANSREVQEFVDGATVMTNYLASRRE